jgi:hypothetical protein
LTFSSNSIITVTPYLAIERAASSLEAKKLGPLQKGEAWSGDTILTSTRRQRTIINREANIIQVGQAAKQYQAAITRIGY